MARHQCIQINWTYSLTAFPVEQYVVDLGVMVHHPQPATRMVNQLAILSCQSFPGKTSVDLGSCFLPPIMRVSDQRIPELAVAQRRVVEIDRQSVGEVKSVSVRLDSVGRRNIQKK